MYVINLFPLYTLSGVFVFYNYIYKYFLIYFKVLSYTFYISFLLENKIVFITFENSFNICVLYTVIIVLNLGNYVFYQLNHRPVLNY